MLGVRCTLRIGNRQMKRTMLYNNAETPHGESSLAIREKTRLRQFSVEWPHSCGVGKETM
jgi:hypothetical protein